MKKKKNKFDKRKIYLVLLGTIVLVVAVLFFAQFFSTKAADTGLLSPSANSAVPGQGDIVKPGYELNPSNAYDNDTDFASDIDSGANTNATCISANNDKHDWSYYNIDTNIPVGSVIKGIEVQQYLSVSSLAAFPFTCVSLSWDGGSTFTDPIKVNLSSINKTIYTFGGPSVVWTYNNGSLTKFWNLSDLSNSNFVVRTSNGDTVSTSLTDYFLYWVPVKVYYNTPTTSTFNSYSELNDGSGNVNVSLEIADVNGDNNKAKLEYTSDTTCNAGWTKTTLTGVATADYNDTGGPPDINNANAYQIGSTATTQIITSSGSNTINVVWDSMTDIGANEGQYCLRLTANDGTADQNTPATLLVNIDNLAPTGLTALNTDIFFNMVTLTWNPVTETNFKNYKIWYGKILTDVQNRTGTALSVTIEDKSRNSSKIGVLDVSSDYYFQIWATDNYGNESTVPYATATIGPDVVPGTSYTYVPPPEPVKEEVAQDIYNYNPQNILAGIAKELGVTVEQLIEWNKDNLFSFSDANWKIKYDKSQSKLLETVAQPEGEQPQETNELKINEPQEETITVTPTPVDSQINYYTVQRGDSLSSIAQKVYGASNKWYNLVKLNSNKYPNITVSPYIIVVGWILMY